MVVGKRIKIVDYADENGEIRDTHFIKCTMKGPVTLSEKYGVTSNNMTGCTRYYRWYLVFGYVPGIRQVNCLFTDCRFKKVTFSSYGDPGTQHE